MPKIYFTSSEGYESEAFYNEDGKQLASWACNDAHWRGEYMDRLLHALGYEVDYTQKFRDDFESQLREIYGEPW